MRIHPSRACAFFSTVVLTVTTLLTACASPEPEPPSVEDLVGVWRAVFESPGGELPITLEISREGEALSATAWNGVERVPFSGVILEDRRVILETDWYDSRIEAEFAADGELRGEWSKTVPSGISRLPFYARRGDARRFLPVANAGSGGSASESIESVEGSWEVVFSDEDGSEPAVGEFSQEGERVTGTFLTPTGDYRYLEGDFRDGLLRLSCFDGAHVFLFHARALSDGTLEGDFWSRESYHATWTARRLGGSEAGEAKAILPDPFEQAGLAGEDDRITFSFPDLDGETVSFDDSRFAGKVVLVDIFGSWCPNCNDEAPRLADWDRRYRDRGLEIVGLAFEFTGDEERDRRLVRRYGERHGLEYPLLLAGVSDKKKATETLGFLDRVVAYPTNVFIGRDGRVRRVHTGITGPGTGEHHDRMVAELEGLIEDLLAEPAPHRS